MKPKRPKVISPWLTATEAQRYLHITRPTLDRMVKEGKLKHSQPFPRIVRFHREELDRAMLDSQS